LILDSLPLAVLGVLVAVLGIMLARTLSNRSLMMAAGPVALICLTPLIPPQSIVLGIGIDDVLPLTGMALLLLTPGTLRGVRQVAASSRVLIATAAIGLGIFILAGLLSAVMNGSSLIDAASLFLRSAGRYAFVAAIAALVASSVLNGSLSARAVLAIPALAGAVISGVSLVLFFSPLRQVAGVAPGDTFDLMGVTLIAGRLTGTTGVANFTAAVAMVACIAAAGTALLSNGRSRALYVGIVIIDLLVIALSGTRSTFALTGVAIVVLIVLAGRPLLLVPFAVVAAVVATATPLLNRFLSGATDRLALWTSSLRMMLDHPLAGVGAGRTVAAMQENPERYVDTPFGPATATAHNVILLAGAELGVLGLVGVLLIITALAVGAARALWRMVRVGREGWVGATSALAVLAFLGQSMTNNLVTIGSTGVMAAVLVGALLSQLSPGPVERATERAKLGAGVQPSPQVAGAPNG
jgi:hypothetical protein